MDGTAKKQSGKVRVNNVMIYFTAAGEGSPVLLIHGWMGTSYHWRKVIPLLAPFAVRTFDPFGAK